MPSSALFHVDNVSARDLAEAAAKLFLDARLNKGHNPDGQVEADYDIFVGVRKGTEGTDELVLLRSAPRGDTAAAVRHRSPLKVIVIPGAVVESADVRAISVKSWNLAAALTKRSVEASGNAGLHDGAVSLRLEDGRLVVDRGGNDGQNTIPVIRGMQPPTGWDRAPVLEPMVSLPQAMATHLEARAAMEKALTALNAASVGKSEAYTTQPAWKQAKKAFDEAENLAFITWDHVTLTRDIYEREFGAGTGKAFELLLPKATDAEHLTADLFRTGGRGLDPILLSSTGDLCGMVGQDILFVPGEVVVDAPLEETRLDKAESSQKRVAAAIAGNVSRSESPEMPLDDVRGHVARPRPWEGPSTAPGVASEEAYKRWVSERRAGMTNPRNFVAITRGQLCDITMQSRYVAHQDYMAARVPERTMERPAFMHLLAAALDVGGPEALAAAEGYLGAQLGHERLVQLAQEQAKEAPDPAAKRAEILLDAAPDAVAAAVRDVASEPAVASAVATRIALDEAAIRSRGAEAAAAATGDAEVDAALEAMQAELSAHQRTVQSLADGPLTPSGLVLLTEAAADASPVDEEARRPHPLRTPLWASAMKAAATTLGPSLLNEAYAAAAGASASRQDAFLRLVEPHVEDNDGRKPYELSVILPTLQRVGLEPVEAARRQHVAAAGGPNEVEVAVERVMNEKLAELAAARALAAAPAARVATPVQAVVPEQPVAEVDLFGAVSVIEGKKGKAKAAPKKAAPAPAPVASSAGPAVEEMTVKQVQAMYRRPTTEREAIYAEVKRLAPKALVAMDARNRVTVKMRGVEVDEQAPTSAAKLQQLREAVWALRTLDLADTAGTPAASFLVKNDLFTEALAIAQSVDRRSAFDDSPESQAPLLLEVRPHNPAVDGPYPDWADISTADKQASLAAAGKGAANVGAFAQRSMAVLTAFGEKDETQIAFPVAGSATAVRDFTPVVLSADLIRGFAPLAGASEMMVSLHRKQESDDAPVQNSVVFSGGNVKLLSPERPLNSWPLRQRSLVEATLALSGDIRAQGGVGVTLEQVRQARHELAAHQAVATTVETPTLAAVRTQRVEGGTRR